MERQANASISMFITGIVLSCFVALSMGRCKPKTQLVGFNVEGQVPKFPFGLQQCERECFSDKNCQMMVFHVNNLACYKVTNIGSNEAGDGFVVKLRSEIASNLDSSYLCGNVDCEDGFFCVALASGVSVCMPGACEQPASIANAVVNEASYSISSTATYSCNDGYHAIGTTEITCTSAREWTQVTFICCKNEFTYDSETQMMYRVFVQNKYYSEAKSYCSGLGSELVKINTTQRMNVLAGYLSDGQYFTDASDQVNEGNWIFSDGTSVDSSLFGPNEPDGGTNENCAIFGYGVKLYDVVCNSNRLFICEIR